jgi:succinate dehydrogenase / fumarate reductase iron-sulfur subunit
LIVRSSDQAPRITLFERFPVPKSLGVPESSRIERGRTGSALAGATRVRTFDICRYDPDSDNNPDLDSFEVDLDDRGAMVLNVLLWIKSKIDSRARVSRAFRVLRRQGVARYSSRGHLLLAI